MTQYTVRIEDEALEQLIDLAKHIATQATPQIATSFTDKVLDHAKGLDLFPYRGTERDDIRPGLRTISYRKRVTIAFTIDDDAHIVSVIGFFYGGRDWETLLSNP